MDVAEYRTDVWTGRQVIVASNRSKRPQMVSGQTIPAEPADDNSEVLNDPFLEGREQETPHESLAFRRNDTNVDQPGWLLRVVANRYPAVAPLTDGSEVAAVGVHDVVIECADFRRSWLQFSSTEVARVLTAWQLRQRQLIQLDGIECIAMFRNQGAAAGASLGHSHSQIVALNRIPNLVRLRTENAAGFFRWRDAESANAERVIFSDRLLAVCPESSWVAGQIRICPPADSDLDQVAFHQLPVCDLNQLAVTLKRCLQIVEDCFPGACFNLVLNQPPVKQVNVFPWSIDIMPRTASFAGFELGFDLPIVTVAPEQVTRAYRAAFESRGDKFDVPVHDQPDGYSWTPVSST